MRSVARRVWFYEIVEHDPLNQEPPEPFGDMLFDRVVRPHDVVDLRWLDGRYAYTVKVMRVHNGTLHVVRVEDPGPTPGHNED